MTRNDYRKQFAAIEALHRNGSYLACVRECGVMFEVAFREVLTKLATSGSKPGAQSKIPTALRDLMSNARPTLGVFVECIRDDEVQRDLRIYCKSNLPRLRRIAWKGINAIRNEAVHSAGEAKIDCEDSLQMKYWLQLFLEDTRLIGKKKVSEIMAPHVHSTCEQCKGPLSADWQYCPKCGTCIHNNCINCGSVLEPNFKICPYCETPVRGGTHASARAIHDYELMFKGAFLDMVLSRNEEEMLEVRRLELGLTPEEAEEIHTRCIPQHIREYQRLVEAALADGSVNPAERALLDSRVVKLGIDRRIADSIELHLRPI